MLKSCLIWNWLLSPSPYVLTFDLSSGTLSLLHLWTFSDVAKDPTSDFHVLQITCFPSLMSLINGLVQIFTSKCLKSTKTSVKDSAVCHDLGNFTTLTKLPCDLITSLNITQAPQPRDVPSASFKEFSLIFKIQFTSAKKPFCKAKANEHFLHHIKSKLGIPTYIHNKSRTWKNVKYPYNRY